MAIIFKCKICGGSLELHQDGRVGSCAYCGSTMTLPKLDDQRRVELFNRGNHFRRNGDYDKAAGVFDTVLGEDPTDAEAYWSLVLCRYGIAYVEDGKDGGDGEGGEGGRRTPTINRIQAASILADTDYQQALAHSEGQAKALYQSEAAAISAIQKAALAVAQSEQPYDVFICYKETDSFGQRSKDSVLAQELYQELGRNGIRAFFARVSLESKGGSEYEPIIFAALQSARAMVVLGTAKEHFDAPWVRNEWSRFQALMRQQPEKRLYPVYRDMDAYDLPEEMSALQAYDAARLGFMQDLVHGLKKVVEKDGPGAAAGAPATAAQAVGGTAATAAVSAAAPLVKRARLMCEDGDFAKAQELVEQALNLDPENGEAYLLALMADCQCKQEEQLGSLVCELSKYGNYQKATRFGDDVLKARLKSYQDSANAKWDERQRKEAEERRIKEEEEAKEQRKKEEAEAARIREEARIAAIMQPIEDFLNGKLSDSPAARQRLGEVQAAINKLYAQEQQLQAQRGSLGFFAGDEKRQLDAQISHLQSQRFGFEAEAQALSGKPQQSSYQWRVIGLDEADRCALAITKDIIAEMPYDNWDKDITWDECALRRWLNGEFYNSLPVHIKSRIVEVVNQNLDNPKYKTAGGNPTWDKVFLLSIDEVEYYFKDDNDRKAQYQGADYWWWLRSPGIDARRAANVYSYGSVYAFGAGGNDVGYGIGGVRPALWLNL